MEQIGTTVAAGRMLRSGLRCSALISSGLAMDLRTRPVLPFQMLLALWHSFAMFPSDLEPMYIFDSDASTENNVFVCVPFLVGNGDRERVMVIT